MKPFTSTSQSGIRDDFNYYGDFYFAQIEDRKQGLEDRRKINSTISCSKDNGSNDAASPET
ncbi:hypothetical protein OCU04_001100 [Sclerotinia nivalis]|uniref:Uncharacterized protein n=1 Tax=Sclerotinia nivalis TaxID=352851 RepID=A0A9X0AXF3_9HELO|nr:hypothetical protein OCU04_001100 [Sclerotinia nivalis]